MDRRLIHDRAYAMAIDLLATVKNCLREEEWRDAFEEFYTITKAGLEEYVAQASRQHERQGGSVNPDVGRRRVRNGCATEEPSPPGDDLPPATPTPSAVPPGSVPNDRR